jgi:hypothetical protein
LPHLIYFPWTRVDETPHPTADDGAQDPASICVAAAIISRRRMCWPGLLPFWLQWWQQGVKVGRGQHKKKKVTITCCIFSYQCVLCSTSSSIRTLLLGSTI